MEHKDMINKEINDVIRILLEKTYPTGDIPADANLIIFNKMIQMKPGFMSDEIFLSSYNSLYGIASFEIMMERSKK